MGLPWIRRASALNFDWIKVGRLVHSLESRPWAKSCLDLHFLSVAENIDGHLCAGGFVSNLSKEVLRRAESTAIETEDEIIHEEPGSFGGRTGNNLLDDCGYSTASE